MADELVYVPGEDDTFVELSRSRKGRLFRKHILSKGTLHYPGIRGGKVNIDDEFLAKLSENFDKKVCPIVQTPVVGDDNAHSEDPLRNIGEVVGLEVDNGKLYSIIDARDEQAAGKLGKTLIGASAMMSLDYTDTRTGKRAGPALLHVAITNRPHLTELDDFEEVLAASADSSNKAVMLSSYSSNKEEKIVDLDTLISVAREEHGIDIPALQRAEAEAESFAALSAQLRETLSDSGVLKLSAEDGDATEDIVAGVTKIMETNLELSAKVDTLVEDSARTKAEARIDKLVDEGFITPAKRDANLNLLLSNEEMFDQLLPEKPLVVLSAESGKEITDPSPDTVIESEIARLTADAASQGHIVQA